MYALRSQQLTLLRGKREDDTTFGRRQLVFLLEHYKSLKAAIRSPEVWPLYERISRTQALTINLATINAWFEMHPDKDSFGILPYEDQELLAGMKPGEPDPMAHLTAGVLSAAKTTAIEELTAALIQYTPAHFTNIRCTIKEGVEGQRALFYQIECREFPDDRTTDVSDLVHHAPFRTVSTTMERTRCNGAERHFAWI